MNEQTFREMELLTSKLNMDRDRYINNAIACYNLLQKRKIISAQLKMGSKIVGEESMKVLSEFENLRDGNKGM